jgi:hypothetical protein
MIQLRETYDESLLQKELAEQGMSGTITRIVNPWYFRKKDTETWIKIGESDDAPANFPVCWNTNNLEDGRYEVMGLMHVIVKQGTEEKTIAGQNVVEITVKN